jgi:hypothetical protein
VKEAVDRTVSVAVSVAVMEAVAVWVWVSVETAVAVEVWVKTAVVVAVPVAIVVVTLVSLLVGVGVEPSGAIGLFVPFFLHPRGAMITSKNKTDKARYFRIVSFAPSRVFEAPIKYKTRCQGHFNLIK